jgi:hypothetical protein
MVMQSPVPAAAPGAGINGPASPARTPSALKGTMVGVAPPGMDDLRKQIAEARQNPAAAATPAPAPAGPSKLKGTMIGLAPPHLAGGDLQPTLLGVAPPGSDAPPAAAQQPVQTPPTEPAPMPSRLKGTMVGVAPPDLGNVQSPDAFGGTLMAGATAPMAAIQPQFEAPATSATEPSPPPTEPPQAGGSGFPGAFPTAQEALRPARIPEVGGVGGPRYPISDTASSLSATTKATSSQLPILLLIGLIVILTLALVAFGFVMRGDDEETEAAPSPSEPAAAPAEPGSAEPAP